MNWKYPETLEHYQAIMPRNEYCQARQKKQKKKKKKRCRYCRRARALCCGCCSSPRSSSPDTDYEEKFFRGQAQWPPNVHEMQFHPPVYDSGEHVNEVSVGSRRSSKCSSNRKRKGTKRKRSKCRSSKKRKHKRERPSSGRDSTSSASSYKSNHKSRHRNSHNGITMESSDSTVHSKKSVARQYPVYTMANDAMSLSEPPREEPWNSTRSIAYPYSECLDCRDEMSPRMTNFDEETRGFVQSRSYPPSFTDDMNVRRGWGDRRALTRGTERKQQWQDQRRPRQRKSNGSVRYWEGQAKSYPYIGGAKSRHTSISKPFPSHYGSRKHAGIWSSQESRGRINKDMASWENIPPLNDEQAQIQPPSGRYFDSLESKGSSNAYPRGNAWDSSSRTRTRTRRERERRSILREKRARWNVQNSREDTEHVQGAPMQSSRGGSLASVRAYGKPCESQYVLNEETDNWRVPNGRKRPTVRWDSSESRNRFGTDRENCIRLSARGYPRFPENADRWNDTEPRRNTDVDEGALPTYSAVEKCPSCALLTDQLRRLETLGRSENPIDSNDEPPWNEANIREMLEYDRGSSYWEQQFDKSTETCERHQDCPEESSRELCPTPEDCWIPPNETDAACNIGLVFSNEMQEEPHNRIPHCEGTRINARIQTVNCRRRGSFNIQNSNLRNPWEEGSRQQSGTELRGSSDRGTARNIKNSSGWGRGARTSGMKRPGGATGSNKARTGRKGITLIPRPVDAGGGCSNEVAGPTCSVGQEFLRESVRGSRVTGRGGQRLSARRGRGTTSVGRPIYDWVTDIDHMRSGPRVPHKGQTYSNQAIRGWCRGKTTL